MEARERLSGRLKKTGKEWDREGKREREEKREKAEYKRGKSLWKGFVIIGDNKMADLMWPIQLLLNQQEEEARKKKGKDIKFECQGNVVIM